MLCSVKGPFFCTLPLRNKVFHVYFLIFNFLVLALNWGISSRSKRQILEEIVFKLKSLCMTEIYCFLNLSQKRKFRNMLSPLSSPFNTPISLPFPPPSFSPLYSHLSIFFQAENIFIFNNVSILIQQHHKFYSTFPNF